MVNSTRIVLPGQLFALLVFGMMSSFAGMAQTAAQTKLGFVDVERVIQDTKAGKAARAQLEKQFNDRKKDLEKREEDLRKKSEDLNKRASVMSEEARVAKQTEMQTEMVKYRELVLKNQQEIEKQERDLTAPILSRIQEVIDSIAKAEGYAMIFSLRQNQIQVVLWASQEADLTARVVEMVDKLGTKSSSKGSTDKKN